MTYTDDTAAPPPEDAAKEDADLAGSDGEDAIVYPPSRGREALNRAASWLQARAMRLASPEPLVTLVVVGFCVGFMFWRFDPSLLFLNTTISGGDTGAHVLLPWVARHQLLPNFRLTGWTSSNWDGFPAVTYYFPLPVYSTIGLMWLHIPYNVAFKIVTAAPMIFLPVAAWLMGRLARAPFPVPAVLAAATLPFMFGTEFSIYGGNIASTLAGEFAFAWSLWFALVFLGLVMRGLQTGRGRAWTAVVLACMFMSHIDPTMFAAVGAVVLVGMHLLRNRDWRAVLYWALPSFVVGGLLAAWWALPYFWRFSYLTDMGYQRITNYLATLFPSGDTWLFVMAAIGAFLSLARRRRLGEFITIMNVLSVIAFRFMPQGILWNARVLPFWFLTLYLLAGLALVESYALLAERYTRYMVTLRAAILPAPLIILVLALTWVCLPLRIMPGEHEIAGGEYSFLGMEQTNDSYITSWISWNYSGYEYTGPNSGDVKSRWGEYEDIVREMETLSKTYGCGNLMWEYQSEMNDYGTPDALTILPYWTNGCIGSMEGLYYEASATTPFHFIDQAELSLQPSDPMRLVPYPSSPDVVLGVQHLQMLGVKYYMALSPQIQQVADKDPSLKLVATLGPYTVDYSGSSGPTGDLQRYWKIYLVLGAPRVHPLANQPVVMQGLNNASQTHWDNVMFNWYDDPSDWDVYLAATGPSNWKTVPYGQTGPPVTPEPSTQVSDVVEHNASIDFNVSRIGVPIAVTISYYPNWQVSGAEGPYRVSPNLMVVVPTSHHVHMWYGETPVDYSGWALTILALVGLVVLVRRPQAAVGALAATSGQALGQSSWTPVAAGGWGAGSYGYGPPPGSQGSGAPPDGPSGQPAPDVPPGSEQPEAPAQGPPAQDADQPAPDKVVDQPAPPGPEPWRPHYEPAIYQPATYEPARAVPPSELVAADEPTGPVTAAEPSVADGPSAIARGGPDPDSGAEQRGEA